MLMDIRCSAVTSIAVDLTFDDHSKKRCVVGVGDLIAVDFNSNGLRKHAEGVVIAVSASGSNQKDWYIIVDCSDDFESNKVRFCPLSILDIRIIRKADTLSIIKTPIGHEGVPYLRIVKGRLQYSKDGFEWHTIKMDSRDIIEDAEGTVPVNPPDCHCNSGTCTSNTTPADDEIEDAIY